MRVLVLAGCVSVLMSLVAAFKIPDFISDLVDGKDNKRQDAFSAGVVDQAAYAFTSTLATSLALRLIEFFDNQAIATTATQGKYVQ